MHHHVDRLAHTTAFVTTVGYHWLERNMDQWIHPKGSIRRCIEPRGDALTTELYLVPYCKTTKVEDHIHIKSL